MTGHIPLVFGLQVQCPDGIFRRCLADYCVSCGQKRMSDHSQRAWRSSHSSGGSIELDSLRLHDLCVA